MEQQRTLEITLQKATGLGKVKYFGKMAVYAVVSVSEEHNDLSYGKFESPVDRDGDTRPTWDFIPPAPFTVGETALQGDSLTLRFNLLCQRYYGDVDVGTAKISVKRLLNYPAAADTDGWRSTSISVKKPGGGRHGLLNFLYKFKGGTIPPLPLPPPPPPSQGADWTKILTGMTNATEKVAVCLINAVIKIVEHESASAGNNASQTG